MENALRPIAALLEQTPWLAAAAISGAVLVFALGGALGLAVGFALARGGRARTRDRFAALAAEALRQNGEGFLALASERFQRLEASAEAERGARDERLEQAVVPLREALREHRSEALRLERERATAVGKVGEQLRALAEETSKLSGALRGGPAARGRWGELTLRRTAELAGLSEHCDFAEQTALPGADTGPGGRPDMIVRLPGGRELAVDAKAPLDAYLDAAEAAGAAARAESLARHAKNVRRHVDSLAGRGYAERLERAPSFVVLFLPDEGFLAAAVGHDRALVEHALAKGVVIATPASLYALLGAVAQGWREARLAEGTRQILAHARELDERLGSFLEHLGRVGAALGRSVDAYNAAVGSLESRLLPQARRMRELGVEGRRAIDAPERVGAAARTPSAAADRAARR